MSECAPVNVYNPHTIGRHTDDDQCSQRPQLSQYPLEMQLGAFSKFIKKSAESFGLLSSSVRPADSEA